MRGSGPFFFAWGKVIDHIQIHIPATGGTSLRDAIGSRRIVHDLARNHYQRDGVDWNRYYKYSCVRNTYDRTVSICAKLHHCRMHDWFTPDVLRRAVIADVARGVPAEESIKILTAEHRKHPRGQWLTPGVFRAWVKAGMPDTRIHSNDTTAKMCTPQKEYLITEDGEWLVDHVISFEHFERDLPALCEKLQIAPTTNFENKNPSARSLDYHDYFDPESKERVEDHFRMDLEEWQHPF